MPRIQQTDPESQPVAASADNPARRPTPGIATDTPRPPEFERPDSALFRVFLATGADAVTAYTAIRDMEITVGQNVANSIVAQLGVQIQAVATRIGEVETNLKSDLATVKSDLAMVKTDLAMVKTDLAMVKTDLAMVKTDLATVKETVGTLGTAVAVLKREVRLIWAGLFLAVPTLTAVVIRFFGG